MPKRRRRYKAALDGCSASSWNVEGGSAAGRRAAPLAWRSRHDPRPRRRRKQEAGAKYRNYFEHSEALARIPRTVAGAVSARKEEILYLDLDPGKDAEAGHLYGDGRVALHAGISDQGRAADRWLLDSARMTWRAKLHLHLLLDLFSQAREKAEAEAIAIFGDNLKDLLLAAPAGARTVMGLDPASYRLKVAVVDRTGKLVATDTIYPHEPRNNGTSRCMRWASCALSMRGADRDRQRHRLARDRQAGR